MDVREKLVEMSDIQVLQREIECVKRKSATNCADCLNCDLLMTDERILSAYANAIDALQNANGVTVQEWIPVTERLPEVGEYVLCVLKGFNYGGKIQVCKFAPADKFKDKPYFEHFRNGFPSVTHWMPLPQLPKGE